MLLKIIGLLLVVAASTAIGYWKAGVFTARLYSLRQIDSILTLLKSEIGYGLTPLPEAFAICAQDIEAGAIFRTAAYAMKHECESAREAWLGAVEAHCGGLCLAASDVIVLKQFAPGLSAEDKDGQLKNIDTLTERVKRAAQNADDDNRRLGKLYRSFGILGGMLIAVILI